MNLNLTIEQLKNLSIDEIIRLYKLGYRINDTGLFKNESIKNESIKNILTNTYSIIDPFVNFGKAIVSGNYDSFSTIIVLNTGNGSIFPDPSIYGPFNLVWWNSTDYPDPSDDPNKEIVRCTVRSGDILTISRAQEGTTASTKNISGKIYRVVLSITAKVFADIQTDAQSRVNAGILSHSSQSSGIHGTIGSIVGTVDFQTLTNKIITDPSNNILASSLKSSTTAIDISSSPAPTTGQILMATSSTTATWQNLIPPSPPTCFFASILGSPTNGPFPLSVYFNATIIGGTSPYTYSWSFGDGGISISPAPFHTYVANGIYTAILTVIDSNGATATSTTTITVLTGIGIVASGLGMSESMIVPDFLAGFYNKSAESATPFSDEPSIVDSLAGIYNASAGSGSSLLDGPIIREESLVMLSSLSIPTTATVNVGMFITLSPTCTLYGSPAGCPILSWSSSAPSKATVDMTGKVTGVAIGTTNITTYFGSVVSNICTVTVIS